MIPFDFVRRRTAAAAEGFLVALIAAMIAAVTGLGLLAAVGYEPASGDVLQGVLVVRHGDDFAHGKAVGHAYSLLAGSSETELVFQGARPDDSLSGHAVRVTGSQQGSRFVVAAGGTKQVGGSTGSGSPAIGTRRVAVVLVNFSNNASEPYTAAFAAGIAFNNADSVAAYYAESSWGQLTIHGDVFGWYTLPETDSSCATGTWATSATSAAAANGVDLSTYDNVVYAFPYVSGCAWSGLATLPGRSSWLNGPSAMSLRVMAHELGHNFGTHHASSLNCTDAGVRVALSSTCTTNEYGDPFTVMGSATHYEHTNFSRGNFGWLANANIQTVTGSGTYTIKPIDTDDPTGVQVLRIPRDDSGWYLVLEYRQPAGAFDSFATTAPVVNGVTARLTGDLSAARQSQLVDSTPATSTFNDAPLTIGATLVDGVSGISISTLTVSSAGATVRVVFSSIPTPTSAPTASAVATATPRPTPLPTATPTATPGPTPGPDAEAPTTPGGLTAAVGKGKKVSLTWFASSDNVAVAGYRVFRDGVGIGSTSGTGYTDAVPGKSTAHTYYVMAFDTAGNLSAPSEPIAITP
jgi:hypothetical protein